jgi:hypothetical protein
MYGGAVGVGKDLSLRIIFGTLYILLEELHEKNLYSGSSDNLLKHIYQYSVNDMF